MAFSSRDKAIAIAPKFTSLLSMLGSGFIILDQLRMRNNASGSRANTRQRILVGMSTCDVLVSTWFFLTTWPIPDEEDVFGASGNQTSCIAQGFFSQFSIAVALYNGSLSIYYLTIIRFGWAADRTRRRLEPWLHAVPLIIGIGTSTAGVFLDLYNNDSWECWISPRPLDCNESWKNQGESNCTRGDNASLYRWILYYAILWLTIIIVMINMYLVYRAVLAKEKAMERYTVSQERQRKHSQKVANQGYWYCGAFFATWFFPTITRLVQVIAGETPYPLILVTAMFVPIQGFFNCLVYINPRYKTLKRSWNSLSFSIVPGRPSAASIPTQQMSSHMLVSGTSGHIDVSNSESLNRAVSFGEKCSANSDDGPTQDSAMGASQGESSAGHLHATINEIDRGQPPSLGSQAENGQH